jgi:hypothetical protein
MSREAGPMTPAAFGFWTCTFTWTAVSVVIAVVVAVLAFLVPPYGGARDPVVAISGGALIAAFLAPATFLLGAVVGLGSWAWAAGCRRAARDISKTI